MSYGATHKRKIKKKKRVFKAPPPEYPVCSDWSAHIHQTQIIQRYESTHRVKGGTTDEAFPEHSFLWERGASLSADFNLS